MNAIMVIFRNLIQKHFTNVIIPNCWPLYIDIFSSHKCVLNPFTPKFLPHFGHAQQPLICGMQADKTSQHHFWTSRPASMNLPRAKLTRTHWVSGSTGQTVIRHHLWAWTKERCEPKTKHSQRETWKQTQGALCVCVCVWGLGGL